jgi:hypothetical protein
MYDFGWLFAHLSMGHVTSIENLLLVRSFVAARCIFSWPKTLPTRVFCFYAKKIFMFVHVEGKMSDFVSSGTKKRYRLPSLQFSQTFKNGQIQVVRFYLDLLLYTDLFLSFG